MNTPNPSDNSNNAKPTFTGEREGAGRSAKKPHPAVPHGDSVQYRYALDDSGKAVDIRSLNQAANILGRTFHCLGCGEVMIPKLGEQLAHHFSHKPNSCCSGETYLHQLAKQVFKEEFEFCQAHQKPFLIELWQRSVCNHHGNQSAAVCQTKPRLRTYDLVPLISSLQVEKHADEFVPDIALFGKDNIWIEFAVSHACSTAKLKSKHRIIEIQIQSEADVALFRHHRLSAEDNRVQFIHFPDRVPEDLCQWYSHCCLGKRFFVVYPDGKLDIRYETKNAALPESVKQKAVWWEEEFIHQGDKPATPAEYDVLLRDATLRWSDAVQAAGHVIRACGLCRHYDQQGEAGCLKYKISVPWREAITCDDFDASIPIE